MTKQAANGARHRLGIRLLLLLSAACTGTPPLSVATPLPAASVDEPAPAPTDAQSTIPAAPPAAVSVGEAFASVAGDSFVLEDTYERRLWHTPWPKARYAIVAFRPTEAGEWTIAYKFTRTRDEEPKTQQVRRAFSIRVLPSGSRRALFLSHPYAFPIALGDSVELPVPLDDPFGTLGAISWEAPQRRALEAPFVVPPCPTEPSLPPNAVEPAFVPSGTGCQEILLANLQTRTRVWRRYVATKPGPAPSLRMEVIQGTGPVLAPANLFVERVVEGSTSTTMHVDREATIPLRLNDEVWRVAE